MVRLARGVSGVPSNDGSPAFTQSGLLAIVFGVACLVWAGCRDELWADCDAGSYDLYFSWLSLRLRLWWQRCRDQYAMFGCWWTMERQWSVSKFLIGKKGTKVVEDCCDFSFKTGVTFDRKMHVITRRRMSEDKRSDHCPQINAVTRAVRTIHAFLRRQISLTSHFATGRSQSKTYWGHLRSGKLYSATYTSTFRGEILPLFSGYKMFVGTSLKHYITRAKRPKCNFFYRSENLKIIYTWPITRESWVSETIA